MNRLEQQIAFIKELEAANRLFKILPQDQSERMMQLWQEYETGQTPEARFAFALDRLMPLIHNFSTSGRAWQEHGITKEQVMERNQKMALGSHTLWEYAKQHILSAVEKGILKDDEERKA